MADGQPKGALWLPPLYSVHIEGSIRRTRERSIIVPEALPYLLDRLFTGQMVTADAFRPFGIRLTIEEDTDGGEESEVIDYRSSWRR